MNRKMRRALEAVKVVAPLRAEETIRNEYLQKCAQAGELQYKIGQMSDSLAALNKELIALNQEYTKVLESKPKEKADATPPATK